MTRNQDFGTRRERQVRDWLRDRDWLAFRAPASLGVADVVALRDGSRPRLIEVKSTHRGPYHGFSPDARHKLRFAAELAGADAYLAWWPPHGDLHWIHVSEWPVRTKVTLIAAEPPTFVCSIDESAGLADHAPP